MMKSFKKAITQRMVWGGGLTVLAFGCIVGVALTTLARWRSPERQDAAVSGVRCLEPSLYVGTIDPSKHEQVSHSFTLLNDTAETIPISDIKTDCGCIVSRNRPTEIAPHGTAKIDVDLTVAPVPGPFRHTVILRVGVSPGVFIPLSIQGDATPTGALFAVSGNLNFGIMNGNEEKTLIAQVRRYDGSPVRVSQIKSDLQSALHFNSAEAGGLATISVVLNSGSLKPGRVLGSLFIEADNSLYTSLKIPITGRIAGVADAFVSSLFIESMHPNARQEFSVYKSSPLVTKPVIKDLEYTGDPDISVSLPASNLTATDGWQRKELITLALSSKSKVGDVKFGVIRLFVEQAYGEQIKVPVVLVVK